MSDTPVEMCACGRPLHYQNSTNYLKVMYLIKQHGPTTIVQFGNRAWKFPRHFIALHGLVGHEIPHIAIEFGFEEVKRRA